MFVIHVRTALNQLNHQGMGVDNFFQLGGGGGGGGATPETQAITQRKMAWAIKIVFLEFLNKQLKWGGLSPPSPPPCLHPCRESR